MTNKFKNILVKIFAMTLAIIMTFPANIFASALSDSKEKNKYTASSSIMGEQEQSTNDEEVKSNLLKSDISSDQTDDYIVEKIASLSKATGELTYKIVLKAKTPKKTEEDIREKLHASFAISPNSRLTELKADKVMALDKDGNETETEFKEAAPGILDAKSDITTFKISTDKEEFGLVYYLSAKLDEDVLADIDNDKDSPILALDMILANDNNDHLYIDRYALTKRTEDAENPAEITIDESGNIVEEEKFDLVETDSASLVNGKYKEAQSSLFGNTPATIVWTDYILSSSDEEFTYEFNIDDAQDANSSKIKIDFFEATDKGFVLNNSFSQELPYTNSLKLQVPQGQLARIELSTNVKNDTNPKVFTFNNKEITNPAYTKEANKDETEESSTEDEDPLPAEDSSNNTEKTNPSKDIIADQNEQDFSANSKDKKESPATKTLSNNENGQNSSNDIIADQNEQDFSANSNTKKEEKTTDNSLNTDLGSNSSNDIIADQNDLNLSAISLNKDAYIESLADDKDATNITKATNQIAFALESYNNEEIEWDNFKKSVQTIAKDQDIDQAQVEDILSALIAGLNEDKYKVANIDLADLTNDIYPLDRQIVEPQVAGPEAKLPEKTPDQLAKEKLAEEGVTIEDFQNYMYELEEKYGLTNEDADRIYTENADAIKSLAKTAREEKTTGDVFVSLENGLEVGSTALDNPVNSISWTNPFQIGTHMSQNSGEGIRYSYVPNKPGVNTYEKTYYDSQNNDISYYIMLRPDQLGAVSGTSKFDINVTGGANIQNVEIFQVTQSRRERLAKSFEENRVLQEISNLPIITNDTSKVRNKKSQSNYEYFEMPASNFTYSQNINNNTRYNNSYIIKVKLDNDSIELNTPIKFYFKWQNSTGTIDLSSKPYEYEVVDNLDPISKNALPTNLGDNNITIGPNKTYNDSITQLSASFNIRDNGETLKGYCMMVHSNPPLEGTSYYGRYSVQSSEDIESLVSNKITMTNSGINFISPYDSQKLYEELAAFFYLKDKGRLLGSEISPKKEATSKQEELALQGMIYRILDGNAGKGLKSNITRTVEGYVSDSASYGENETAFLDLPYWGLSLTEGNGAEINQRFDLRKDVTAKIADYDSKITQLRNSSELKSALNSTSVYIYLTTLSNTQAIISGRIDREPPQPKTTSFSFTKYQMPDNIVMPNIKFKLIKNDGTQTKYATSNLSGVVAFDEMLPGSYTLTEETSPDGFEINNTKWDVEIQNHDGTIYTWMKVQGTDKWTMIKDSNSFRIDNTKQPKKGKLTINKNDGNGSGLAGVTFSLTKNGESPISETSTNTGVVTFDNLDPGVDYTLKETSGPTGYKLSLDTWNVRVQNDGSVTIRKNKRENSDGSNFIISSGKNSAPYIENINYASARNDLNVVTRNTAPAEINYQYGELVNGNIDQDTFEYRAAAITDSLELDKSEFRELVDPLVAEGSVYESSRDLTNNVYSVNTSYNTNNVNTLLASGYQANTFASPVTYASTGVLTNNNILSSGKIIDNFVTITDAKPTNISKDKYIIGDTNFKEASRYQRPIIMRNDAGETVFCIDLGVNNPTRTTTKNSRHIEFDSSVINQGYSKKINDTDISNLKKIFYYQNEITREYGLDIVGNEEDKIDLYAAVEANIAYYLYGQAKYDDYLSGKTPQAAGVTSARAKAMAKDLINKVENAEANGWTIYSMKDWVNITYYYPSDKTQRTVTSHIDNPLEFAKVDENGNMISGAEFVIKQGDKVVSKWTSNDKYTHKLQLDAGTYTLEEVSAPAGYAKMQPLTFVVETTTQTVKEDLDLIQLKYPWDEHKDADEIVYTRKSMKLVSGNDFAWLDNTDKALVYLQNNKEVEKPKPNIEFIKTNESYQSLANVRFELKKAGQSTAIQTQTSSDRGRFIFTNLEDGNYEVYETQNSNKGYESNANTNTPIAKFVVSNGEIQAGVEINSSKKVAMTESGSYVITNKYDAPKAKIEFVKVDSTDNKKLSGGRFDLEKELNGQYSIVQSGSANGRGVIGFEGLEDGNYQLRETKAPDGYQTPSGGIVARFSVSQGKITGLTYVNNNGSTVSGIYTIKNNATPKTSDFTIGKVDQYGNTVDGVEFTLYNTDDNGNVISTGGQTRTTSNGQVSFTGLTRNKYYVVRETKVPAGYEPSNETITIKVESDGSVTKVDGINLGINGSFDIINDTNKIEFKKVDAETGKALSGFEFELRQETSRSRATTNTNGLISFEKLKDGSGYELYETKAPEESGYKAPDYPLASFDVVKGRIVNLTVQGNTINTNVPDIQSRLNNNRLTVTNIKNPDPYTITNIKEQERPGVSFRKVDFETKTPIADVIVRLKDETRGRYIPVNNQINIKTDQTGLINFGELRDGKYKLTELRAAPGYINDGQTLAEFEVKDGKIVNLVTNGEKKNPPSSNTPIDVTNQKEVPRAKFTVDKTLDKLGSDKAYSDLYKVEFTLFTIKDGDWFKYAPDDDLEKYPNPRRTNSDGKISFDELEANRTYYLAETDYNPLYKRMGVIWQIDVDEQGKVNISPIEIGENGIVDQEMSKVYQEIPNRILFVKEDENGNRLDVSHMSDAEIDLDINRLKTDLRDLEADNTLGQEERNAAINIVKEEIASLENIRSNYAQFELYKAENGQYVKYADSDAYRMKFKFDSDDTFKGLFGWHDLPSGSYKVKEVRYPQGYVTKRDNSNYTTDLENDFIAEFTVGTEDNQVKVINSTVVSYNGIVPKADDNKYKNEILEYTNPDGISNQGTDNPTLNITNEVLPPVVVKNVADSTDVEFIKKSRKADGSSQPLAGATFELFKRNADNEFVTTGKTNTSVAETGRFKFEGLSSGVYEIRETNVPDGHTIVGNGSKQFEIKNGKVYFGEGFDQELKDNENNVIYNDIVSKGRFRLEKVDEAGKALAGVKFTLTPDDNTGGTPRTKTSDSRGYIEFVNLDEGSYTLEETESVAGYIKTNQKWRVNVDGDGVTTITPVESNQALNSIKSFVEIPTAYAAETNETINLVFIVENLRGKSEGVVEAFNANIDQIKDQLTDTYGDRARIILVANGHNDGQPEIYSQLVTSDSDFKLNKFDEGGGDMHLDEAIQTARNSIKANPADQNNVIIMSSGKADLYLRDYAYNSDIGFFTEEDNITKTTLFVEDENADLELYTKDNRAGNIISEGSENFITGSANVNVMTTTIATNVPSIGLDAPIADVNLPGAQSEKLKDISELNNKGYIIANSKDYEGSNISVIKVVNKKPTYPMTGGNGPKIVFAVLGTAVMIAGIAYYGIYMNDKNRRRSDR